MGTCDSNNNNGENENKEYTNLRASNDYNFNQRDNQSQRRVRLFSDPISDYSGLQRLQPLRRHSNKESNNNDNHIQLIAMKI